MSPWEEAATAATTPTPGIQTMTAETGATEAMTATGIMMKIVAFLKKQVNAYAPGLAGMTTTATDNSSL